MPTDLLEEARDIIRAEVAARGNWCNITHLYEALPGTHPALVEALSARFDHVPYQSWKKYVAQYARKVIDQAGDYWYDPSVEAWRRGPKR